MQGKYIFRFVFKIYYLKNIIGNFNDNVDDANEDITR